MTTKIDDKDRRKRLTEKTDDKTTKAETDNNDRRQRPTTKIDDKDRRQSPTTMMDDNDRRQRSTTTIDDKDRRQRSTESKTELMVTSSTSRHSQPSDDDDVHVMSTVHNDVVDVDVAELKSGVLPERAESPTSP